MPQKIMRDMSFNEEVPITLPAHVWLAFMSQYSTADWSSDAASKIVMEIQEALLDPIYIRERLAEAQAHHDQHLMAAQAFFGQQPDVPPNADDPRDGD